MAETPGSLEYYKDVVIDFLRKGMRPVMAYAFGFAAIALVFTGALDSKVVENVALMVISFLFGERSALKNPEGKENVAGQ